MLLKIQKLKNVLISCIDTDQSYYLVPEVAEVALMQFSSNKMNVTIIELNSYFLYRSIVPYQTQLFNLVSDSNYLNEIIKLLYSLNSANSVVIVNGFELVYQKLYNKLPFPKTHIKNELVNLANLLDRFKGFLICISVAKETKQYHIESLEQDLILPSNLYVLENHRSYFDSFLISQNNVMYKETEFRDFSIIHEISLKSVFNQMIGSVSLN